MHSLYLKVAEKIIPIRTESALSTKGVLTPAEFVEAGDYLTTKNPSWKWASCSDKNKRSELPPEKQYLVVNRVPCRQRISDSSKSSLEFADNDEEWVAPLQKEERVMDLMEEIPTKEIKEEELDEDWGDIVADEQCMENIVRTRTYDVHLTYDRYYQTPRMWLFGYNEHGNPLTQKEMFEDISSDHANKTVTFETHPFLGIVAASIHPCRHAQTMKKIFSSDIARADLYLRNFLKFMGAVLPHIEYDNF